MKKPYKIYKSISSSMEKQANIEAYQIAIARANQTILNMN